jgi:hypothetical protein
VSKGPICHRCKRSPAPLVVEERWTCARCTYELEVGPAIPASEPRPSSQNELLYPQSEHLFPLPPPRRPA